MKQQITITWNVETEGETTVTYSPGFHAMSWIERVDCLQDAIGELSRFYNEQLEKFNNGEKP